MMSFFLYYEILTFIFFILKFWWRYL